MITYKSVNTF